MRQCGLPSGISLTWRSKAIANVDNWFIRIGFIGYPFFVIDFKFCYRGYKTSYMIDIKFSLPVSRHSESALPTQSGSSLIKNEWQKNSHSRHPTANAYLPPYPQS